MASYTASVVKNFSPECKQVQQDIQSATSAHCISPVTVCANTYTCLAPKGATSSSVVLEGCDVNCSVSDKSGCPIAAIEKAKMNMLGTVLSVGTGKDGSQASLAVSKVALNQRADIEDSASGAPNRTAFSSGGVMHDSSPRASTCFASNMKDKLVQRSSLHTSGECDKPQSHWAVSIANHASLNSSRSTKNATPVVVKSEPLSPHRQGSPSVLSSDTSALGVLSGQAMCSGRQAMLPSCSSGNSDQSCALSPAVTSADRLVVQTSSVSGMQHPNVPCLNAAALKNASFVKCQCGFGPVDLEAMEKHIMTNHVKPFSHGCELCDRKFSTRRELRDHFHLHVQENITERHDPSDVHSDPSNVQGASTSLNPTPKPGSSGTVKLEEANPSLISHAGDGENCEARHEPSHSGPINAAGSTSHWLLRRDLAGSELLLSFFKCTVDQCRYTGTRATDFYNHLSSHKPTELSRLLCIYCGKTFDVIADLVQHMESAHRHLVHQCGHCLYRSKLPIHVQLHHKHFHANEKPLIFICTDAQGHTALANIPSQRVSLTHYWCTTSGCGFKCFNPDVFEWHLSTSHPKAEKYTCFICDLPTRSPRALVQHCIGHDMDVVQCGICHHSESTYEKMLKHLCDYHFDSPLYLTFRTDDLTAKFKKFMTVLQKDPGQCTINFVSQYATSVEELVHQSAVATSDNSLVTPSRLSPLQSMKPCPFCPDHLVTLAELMQHCVKVHNISLRISETLELMLKRQSSVLAKERCLFCPFCSFTFLDKGKLQEHMFLEFHYVPIRCEACGHRTLNEAQLRLHSLSVHPHKAPAFAVCKNEDFEAWVANLISQQEAHCNVVEKSYRCVDCEERCVSADELRLHICSHLKYYPYHCRICDECFISQEEVEKHKRTKHNVLSKYSTQEVRFESKELKIDKLIDEATSKVQELLENSSAQQCLWKGCLYKPSVQSELAAHVKQHIGQRKICSQCHFSSYSADVVAWHSREQHSPVSSSSEIPSTSAVTCPTSTNLRVFACSFCSYKGPSSQSIREHSKLKHPGKATKFVAPRRKDWEGLTFTVAESAQKPKEECCTEKLHISLARPKQDTARFSWQLLKKKEKFRCSVCNFLASSEHLLHVHKSDFHKSRPSIISRSDAAIKEMLNDILQPAARAESSATAAVKPKSVQATASVPQSVSNYKCYKCSIHFESKKSLFGHLVQRHHMHAVCDSCGTGLMNTTAAHCHVAKHIPNRSTFTVLRSYLQNCSVESEVQNTSNPSRLEKPLEHTAEIYVVPPWANGTRVPLQEFRRNCNLNVRVLVEDAKLMSSLS